MLRPIVAPLVLLALFALLGGCGTSPRAALAPELRDSEHIACTGRPLLPLGRSLLGSTASGHNLLQGSCVRGAAAECVYIFDLPSRAEVRIGIESVDFDAALVLLDASGDPRAELACVDDTPKGDTHHARIDVTLDAGRYHLVVDGVSGGAGEFELFVQVDPLPNIAATCSAADLLSEGTTFRGRTTGAANQFSATCAGGARGSDHVHAFDLSVASRVRFRQQSEHDAALYLRTRCEDPSTELGCNDDFGDRAHAALALRLPAGRHYLFTDSYLREQAGDYALSFERIDEPPVPSVEAACDEARALSIKPGVFELDTLTAPSVFEGSCGGAGAPEQVLAFTVTERAQLRAEIVDPELNATLYVRARCADAGSELICFRAPRIDRLQATSGKPNPALLLTLEPGDYTLFVDGAEAEDMGAARLQVSLTPSRGLLL